MKRQRLKLPKLSDMLGGGHALSGGLWEMLNWREDVA